MPFESCVIRNVQWPNRVLTLRANGEITVAAEGGNGQRWTQEADNGPLQTVPLGNGFLKWAIGGINPRPRPTMGAEGNVNWNFQRIQSAISVCVQTNVNGTNYALRAFQSDNGDPIVGVMLTQEIAPVLDDDAQWTVEP